jgi:CHASE2 domain-containing sensor protein
MKFAHIAKNKNFLTLFLSLFVCLIVFISSPFLYNFDKSFQNKYYHFKNILFEKKASKSIVVVEIDEKTLAKIGRFPFDRKVYKNIIDNLTGAEAAVIGFDIIFSDTTDLASDSVLYESVKKSKKVVLGTTVEDDGSIGILLPELTTTIEAKGYYPPLIDAKNNRVYSIRPFASFRDGKLYDHFSIALLKSYFSNVF